MIGPVVVIRLVLGAVGVAAAVGGRVPLVRRQRHRGARGGCGRHPHRGSSPRRPEARAGPAEGASASVRAGRGAAGRGASGGAPGASAASLAHRGLAEESGEQETGPACGDHLVHP